VVSRGSSGRPLPAEVLLATARSILAAVKTPDPAAAVVAGSLVESDLLGHPLPGDLVSGPR
jgi:hypothetical protein